MPLKDFSINTIVGQVYVQEHKLGLGSYHFENPINLQHENGKGGCYISYSSAPHDWVLKDGRKPPKKKYFLNPRYDSY